jgi:hypothetical protein
MIDRLKTDVGFRKIIKNVDEQIKFFNERADKTKARIVALGGDPADLSLNSAKPGASSSTKTGFSLYSDDHQSVMEAKYKGFVTEVDGMVRKAAAMGKNRQLEEASALTKEIAQKYIDLWIAGEEVLKDRNIPDYNYVKRMLGENGRAGMKKIKASYESVKRNFIFLQTQIVPSKREPLSNFPHYDFAMKKSLVLAPDITAGYGGIDLNAKNLKIHSTGTRIEMGGVVASVDLGQAVGFQPFITAVSRVTDIQSLLGVPFDNIPSLPQAR